MQLANTINKAEDIMQKMPQGVWRSYDPNEINALIDNRLDATDTLANNVWLIGVGFASFFCNLGNNNYEVHIDVKKEVRGKRALLTAKSAIEYMFRQTDCKKIISAVPSENKAAIMFARFLGFAFKAREKYQFRYGNPVLCDVLTLTKRGYSCHRL